MRFLVLIMLVAVMGGCATTENADSQPPPDIRPTLVAAKSHLFKDPDSIRDAEIATPHRFLGMGWQACFRANGKNGFGGYTGLTTYTIMVYDNGSPPLLQEPTIYSGCGSANYQPFPEIEGGYKPPQMTTEPKSKLKHSSGKSPTI